MKWPMNSKPKIPSIPLNDPISWDDWMAGRRARRQTSKQVAPGVVRRKAGSHDVRLRKLFKDERGLPFRPTDELTNVIED